MPVTGVPNPRTAQDPRSGTCAGWLSARKPEVDGVTVSSVSSVCVYLVSWYLAGTSSQSTHTHITYLHVPMDAKMGNLYTDAHSEANGCSTIITGY